MNMEAKGQANGGGAHPPRPLEGLRILELGQLLAGPFASVILAWFGAEVIKVEPPGVGDPLRRWRKLYKGTALWWYILGRNKKCVTLNLRSPRGQEIARQLVAKVDVVLENFKPGTLEKWGLGYDVLREHNRGIVLVRDRDAEHAVRLEDLGFRPSELAGNARDRHAAAAQREDLDSESGVERHCVRFCDRLAANGAGWGRISGIFHRVRSYETIKAAGLGGGRSIH